MQNRNEKVKELSQYEIMTETPISWLIIRLAIPTIISMMITNVYNLADTAFVGQLGNSASGAVGVVFGFMAIVQAIGFLFGQGAGNLVAGNFLGTIGLLIGAVLNICGDPILMFGLKLGISGAGLSTAISQTISFCILLSMFISGKTTSRLSIQRISLKTALVMGIVTTGLPSLLRQGLNSLTAVLLNTHASVYGDEAVAAMSIVSRVIIYEKWYLFYTGASYACKNKRIGWYRRGTAYCFFAGKYFSSTICSRIF